MKLINLCLLSRIGLELTSRDRVFTSENMELVSDGIVSFHEFDVIKHHKRVVHSANLQVVIDFLL